MTAGSRTKVVQQLRKIVAADAAGLTDGQLLERFVTQRDEAAFEALVRRHGPTVFGVCQRVLCNPHDAEDAFQAAFLVLVRKAASVAPREMVANWLYGVAYQTAFRAKVAAAKRRVRERQLNGIPEPEAARPDLWHDLLPLLDQELNRLPDKYRIPIVLCDLRGKTHAEAARELDWPIGTVSGRLSKGRKMLAGRLSRKGLPLSAGALAAALSQPGVSASVTSSLVVGTVKAAHALAAGQAAAAISAQVAGLTEGVIQAMFLSKLKLAASALMVASILVASVVASGLIDSSPAAQQAGFREESEIRKQPQLQKTVEAPEAAGKKIDLANIGALDERKIMRITAPTAGRIEKIYKASGEQVKKGDALAELFSPDLMVTTREFLAAERGGNAERVARERLQLWGMDRDQISAILKNGKPVSQLTVRSPLDGYVIQKQAIAGAYVKAGDALYDLADFAAIASQAKPSAQRPAEDAMIQALLQERLATLKELENATKAAYLTGKATYTELAQASAFVLKAELELCDSVKQRLIIHEKAVALAKEHERAVAQLYNAGKATQATALAARANRLEAEIAFERAKAEAARGAK